jgi:ABC-type multidrug transport system ATPase subunit
LADLHLYKASKSFGNIRIINDVSFQLSTGQILGIFGRNGCGKSTLLKLLFGTLKSDQIKLTINREEIPLSQIIKRELIGYLPQHSFLPHTQKVRDIIPLYHESQEKQDAVFYDPRIATMTHKRINELSHGERKYFEVILLGNLDHPFLMMDEPFSMLEPLQTIAIKEFITKISEEKGIIITDHYYQDILDISTQNLVMKDGTSYEANGIKDLQQYDYLNK